MPSPHHLLVFRFSSLGDIAMTVPVIRLLLQQHPHLQVTFVSIPFVKPLFVGIERLHFHAADVKGAHKGFKGLYNLYRELKSIHQFDAIADLHGVLRTRLLKFFFSFSGLPVATINKGRKEKKELTRPFNKVLKPLKSTFQRYADVFAAVGLPVVLNIKEGISHRSIPLEMLELKQNGKYLIGIAPFAQYERKMYPIDKMKEVLRLLLQQPDIKVYILGGGQKEIGLLQQWKNEIDEIGVLAGKMSFAEELDWIANMDVMVSMDSANMHLASLYGVRVISVWGATHPFAGFYGWGQAPENAVQVDLYCRPCSVFGNKAGPRNDLACLHAISPLTIYNAIIKVVHHSKTK